MVDVTNLVGSLKSISKSFVLELTFCAEAACGATALDTANAKSTAMRILVFFILVWGFHTKRFIHTAT